MINKRPFPDEESIEFPCKHPKQWEFPSHLAPIVDTMPSNDVCQNPQSSGECCFSKCHEHERFAFKSDAEVSNGTGKEFEIGASGCIPQFWWASGNMVEADANSDASLHLSLFPEYFAPGHQLRTLLNSDEIYSSLLDCPPMKSVSVGPEYQADVPEWDLQGSKDTCYIPDNQVEHVQLSDSGYLVDDGDEDKWMGTCVIPMPDSEDCGSYSSENWIGHACGCLDQGSIRCVRQHVMEAREKLREKLGCKIFEELGFCDMGEGVSGKWTGEEEQEFHDIVFSNPVSMAKNFWDKLSVAFPSRTKKDVVSYYFNVFMLRKRAEQNRFDPVNIDSDNEEWQRSEVGMEDEDEDSGVESLNNQFAPACYHEEDAGDCHHDVAGEFEVDDCQDGADVLCTFATDEDDRGDVDDLLGPHVSNCLADSAGETGLQLLSKIQGSNREDYYIQDDSCTSYEYLQDKVDYRGTLFTGCDAKQSSQGSY